MLPDCLATLRACAKDAPEFPKLRQAAYDHYHQLVTDQLKYHSARIVSRRQRRPRKDFDGDHLPTILGEIEGDSTDVEQSLFWGLAIGVERLRVMPTDDLPDFIDQYLIGEIRSQATEYYAGDSSHVLPKASTNSGRKKGGKAAHAKLVRIASDDESFGELESAPKHPTTIKGAKSSGEYLPSRIVEQQHNARGVSPSTELIDAVAENHTERSILKMLEEGHKDCEIIAALELSSHYFIATRKLLRVRAAKVMGQTPPTLRRAS